MKITLRHGKLPTSRIKNAYSFAFAGGLALISLGIAGAPVACAEEPPGRDTNAILVELEALQSEQNRLAEKIEDLEKRLSETVSEASAVSIMSPSDTILLPSGGGNGAPLISDQLEVSGDMLFRYEGNFSSGSSPDRGRGVMRARLKADYQVNDRLSIGALIETGDPDDPNSGYLTFDEFGDDFDISLSRAFAQYKFGNSEISVGKFPNPFINTDLVWDGDVNPVGLSGSSDLISGSQIQLHAAGLFFIIDEDAAGADSYMTGGQLALTWDADRNIQIRMATSYLDYQLGSVGGADAGDFLTNLRTPEGEYLSDFDLLDVLLSAKWTAISDRWPIEMTVDLVRNSGAATDDDEAFGLDMVFGRASLPGDWSVQYGYSETEVDAVLGAFSHDNYSISTNYMSHEIGLKYVLSEHAWLGGSVYHYKPLRSRYAVSFPSDEWMDRLRLNLGLSF